MDSKDTITKSKKWESFTWAQSLEIDFALLKGYSGIGV
jgi:hypothetical protein